MEHSAVVDAAIEPAIENLTQTYFSLGMSTRDARCLHENGFDVCIGPFEHAISNFAVVRSLNIDSAQILRNIAASRPCFSLYLLPSGEAADHRNILEISGFTHTHELRILNSHAVLPDRVDMQSALGQSERLKVADFMVDQFFHRQSPSFRRGIAEATANAENLNLYRALWKEQAVGAVMLCEHAGAIGLYNLCVEPQFRSRGWGSAIVRTVADQAQERRLSVTLQCEPSLASWYSSLGFKEVGSVSVFGLYRFQEIDIMG